MDNSNIDVSIGMQHLEKATNILLNQYMSHKKLISHKAAEIKSSTIPTDLLSSSKKKLEADQKNKGTFKKQSLRDIDLFNKRTRDIYASRNTDRQLKAISGQINTYKDRIILLQKEKEDRFQTFYDDKIERLEDQIQQLKHRKLKIQSDYQILEKENTRLLALLRQKQKHIGFGLQNQNKQNDKIIDTKIHYRQSNKKNLQIQLQKEKLLGQDYEKKIRFIKEEIKLVKISAASPIYFDQKYRSRSKSKSQTTLRPKSKCSGSKKQTLKTNRHKNCVVDAYKTIKSKASISRKC